MLALNKSEKDGAEKNTETGENVKPDEKDLPEGTMKSEELSEGHTDSPSKEEPTDSPSKEGHLSTSDMEVNEDT